MSAEAHDIPEPDDAVEVRNEEVESLLRLTLTPGLGPVLIARLLEMFGSADAVLGSSALRLQKVRGIGVGTAEPIARGLAASAELVGPELELARRLGVRLLVKGGAGYPELLAQLPDSPPLLYVKGDLRPDESDRYPLAVVGSRRCTAYGIEQAERFAGILARSGITIISGGARGIDTAAHRGALRASGRTVAVLGCGLAEVYPPENAELFERIAESGAVVSELPLGTPPTPDNFPARNRIISGLSLGVLLIEAGHKSGALITARVAGEEHGREVMALPGRVDSTASQGSLQLLKEGGAALVTNPGDVLAILESPARHHHRGSHAARYAMDGGGESGAEFGTFQEGEGGSGSVEASGDGGGDDRVSREVEAKPADQEATVSGASGGLTESQRVIWAALESPATIDELVMTTAMPPHVVRAELTMLEVQRRVRREGPTIARVR